MMVLYHCMFEGNLIGVARAQLDAAERMPYGLLLARLGQESVARFRRSLRPLNLGAQQFIVLKQLQAFGSCSQGELADALGIDYSNLAGVTGELYRRGLIERHRDETRPAPLRRRAHLRRAAAARRRRPGDHGRRAARCSTRSARPSATSSGTCCAGWPTRSSCARAPTPRRVRRRPSRPTSGRLSEPAQAAEPPLGLGLQQHLHGAIFLLLGTTRRPSAPRPAASRGSRNHRHRAGRHQSSSGMMSGTHFLTLA